MSGTTYGNKGNKVSKQTSNEHVPKASSIAHIKTGRNKKKKLSKTKWGRININDRNNGEYSYSHM